MKYAKSTYKRKYTPKYGYGGDSGADAADNVAMAVPGYGMFHGIATSAANGTRSGIKKDKFGTPDTNFGAGADEVLEASHRNAGREFKSGDYAGGVRDILGTGKVTRAISAFTGNSEADSGFWGKFNRLSGQKDKNDERASAEEAQGELDAAAAAEEERVRLEEEAYQKTIQDNYDKAYYSINNVHGNTGASIYAKMGGKIPRYPNGGSLNPIASDTVKAEGRTHEEGGIKLTTQSGKPYAEVEDQEIIKGNNVYSDTLKLPNGNTMAQEAEQWAKVKGKAERKLGTSNYRRNNSANRTAEFADRKLDSIFEYQEAMKIPEMGVRKYGNGSTIDPIPSSMTEMSVEDPSQDFIDDLDHEAYWNSDKSSGFTSSEGTPQTNQPNTSYGRSSGSNFNANQWANIGKSVVPFIDNIYNANLINKTPEIPAPMKKVYYGRTAMPMKTTYDVSNDLTQASNTYDKFNKGIDDNTNSSQIARGNKLAGLSAYLKNKSSIYQNKENIETDLKNRNNMNIQSVNDANVTNKQYIDNLNLDATDRFNWAKMQRTDDILRRKSANVSNAVEDATRLVQDSNLRNLDDEKIMLDAAKYSDGSGYARMIGTPTMGKLVKNSDNYKKVEEGLKKGKQNTALEDFYRTYGRR